MTKQIPKKISMIVVAAGKGSRMGADINKVLLPLLDKPVLIHSLETFQNDPNIIEIILVVSKNEMSIMKNLVEKYEISKAKNLVIGGNTRFNSVQNAVKYLNQTTQFVAVHDGARPLISTTDLEQLWTSLSPNTGAILGTPVTDTLKMVENEAITKTIDRSKMWRALTPQAFPLEQFKTAYNTDVDPNIITDDASLMEYLGYKVKIVTGNTDNLKITTPIDLKLATLILKEKK